MKKTKWSEKFTALSLVVVFSCLLTSIPLISEAADTDVLEGAILWSDNGHYYKVFDNNPMKPKDAEEFCEEMGGYLTTITSEEERFFVESLVEDSKRDCFTIGGTDHKHEGTWTWMNGESWDYTNWNSGEPNNGLGLGEDYIEMDRSRGWRWIDFFGGYNDYELLTKDGVYQEGYFVCEWDDASDAEQINIGNGSIILSDTSLPYNGDQRQPAITVKLNGKVLSRSDYSVSYSDNVDVGKATVTVRGKGLYKGSLKKAFKIVPAKVTNVLLKSTKKGKAQLSWGKTEQTSGYEIQYSRKRTFRGKSVRTIKNAQTTRTTFSGLSSGKTYYMRIRTYTVKDDRYYYGKWSIIRKIKIK